MPSHCSACLKKIKKGESDFECEPKQVAVWDDDEGNYFYNCPSAFIPEHVHSWYQQYIYDVEYGERIPYEKRNNRFLLAIDVYKNAVAKARELKKGFKS